LNNFRTVWSKFDPEATSFISVGSLRKFLQALGPPLGFDAETKKSKFMQEKFLSKLDLPVYNNLQDHMFMDILEALTFQVAVN